MLRKKSTYIIWTIGGIVVIIIGIILRQESLSTKAVEGVCLGIGAGLFGSGISNFLMKSWEEKEPDIMKQKEIEYLDVFYCLF